MFKVAFAAVIACLAAGSVWAANDVARMEHLTRQMLGEAMAHYTKVGHDQARQDFARTEKGRWYQDEYNLHMFGMDVEGLVWADGAWPVFVGTDFSEMTDFRGKAFGRAILEETPTDGGFYRVELTFMSASNVLSISIGSCARPNPDHILCSWTNGN